MNCHFFRLISLKVTFISAGMGTSGSWMSLLGGDWTEDLSVLYEGGKGNVALSEYQQVYFLWAYKLLPHLETWCTWVLLTTVNHFTSCRAKTEDLALDTLALVCYRAFGEISLRRYKVIESSSFYLAFYHRTTKNKDSYLNFLKRTTHKKQLQLWGNPKDNF